MSASSHLARPRIILRALYEYQESQSGRIRDGSAFCPWLAVNDCDASKGKGHNWCSAFYNTMVDEVVQDMSPGPGRKTESNQVLDYFCAHGSCDRTNIDDALAHATKAGDFLAIGKPENPKDSDHTEMFIAFDVATGHAWWVAA